MPFQIIRNDITKMKVDAIVNTSNKNLSLSGGVNGMIHKAAGSGLLDECKTLGGCETGEAKITGAYNLPCRYVIHTVGPIWRGGNHGEEELLQSCYRNCLMLAAEHKCQSVAFPLISGGSFGYPNEKAPKVAMDAISSFLLKYEGDDLMVYLLVFSKESVKIGSKLFSNIEKFIDDHYVDAHEGFRRRPDRQYSRILEEDFLCSMSTEADVQAVNFESEKKSKRLSEERVFALPAIEAPKLLGSKCASPMPVMPAKTTLEEELKLIDESFSEMVIRKINEKGMKNSECYKKANLDKKLFSKIYNDIHYKPKKQTALALAIALELDIEETKELLMKAGLALSRSEKFDIIVEYFIRNRKYNIFEINETLFYYDQMLLGSTMN